MSADIRFPRLSEDLEHRVRRAIKSFVEKSLSDVQMVQFFFQYFFQRIELMYQDHSKVAQDINKALANQHFSIIVPKLVEVTVSTNSTFELSFIHGIDIKAPAITFDGLKTVLDIILSNTTIFKAYMDKQLKIKKFPEILRWLAPIAVLQTPETIARIQEADLNLINKSLLDIGY